MGFSTHREIKLAALFTSEKTHHFGSIWDYFLALSFSLINTCYLTIINTLTIQKRKEKSLSSFRPQSSLIKTGGREGRWKGGRGRERTQTTLTLTPTPTLTHTHTHREISVINKIQNIFHVPMVTYGFNQALRWHSQEDRVPGQPRLCSEF